MPGLPDDAITSIERGQLLEAIRIVRERTGCGLKEAKDAVERHAGAYRRAQALDGGGLPPAAREALARGRTLEAVRIVREATGLGLAQAKAMVDAAAGDAGIGGAGPAPRADPLREPGRVRRGGLVRWWLLLACAAVLVALAWARWDGRF